MTEDAIRREVSRLLRGSFRSQFLCMPCLAAFVRDLGGTTYTKGQIDRALIGMQKSPGALASKRSFICDQCGKTASCFGDTSGRF